MNEDRFLDKLSNTNTFRQKLMKVAEDINKKRRLELLHLLNDNNSFKDWVKEQKKLGTFKDGSKSKVWRKIASLPVEVDQFFTKIYGKDYYKDKDFFQKYASEWMVIDWKDL